MWLINMYKDYNEEKQSVYVKNNRQVTMKRLYKGRSLDENDFNRLN